MSDITNPNHPWNPANPIGYINPISPYSLNRSKQDSSSCDCNEGSLTDHYGDYNLDNGQNVNKFFDIMGIVFLVLIVLFITQRKCNP